MTARQYSFIIDRASIARDVPALAEQIDQDMDLTWAEKFALLVALKEMNFADAGPLKSSAPDALQRTTPMPALTAIDHNIEAGVRSPLARAVARFNEVFGWDLRLPTWPEAIQTAARLVELRGRRDVALALRIALAEQH
jgi:hypothetical protein